MNSFSPPFIHHPLVLSVGPLTVTGFGLAVLMAFLIGQFVGQRELTRRGHDPTPVGDIVLAAMIGFIIGAKIYFAVLMHSWDALFNRSGFVFWGGLAGGILAAYVVIRRKRIPFSRIADVGAIGIAAGYAVGRSGCWAVGDDYGKPWPGGFLAVEFPEGAPASTVGIMQREFGVQFPAGTDPASIVAVYPTQLLEVALGLVMFFVLWRLRDHKHAEGWLFGVYGVLAGAERFLVEFYRAKDDRLLHSGLSLAQLIALGAMVAGFIWMRMRRDPTPDAPGIYALPLSNRRPAATSRLSASRR